MSAGWALAAVLLAVCGVALFAGDRAGAGVALVVLAVVAGAVAVSDGDGDDTGL